MTDPRDPRSPPSSASAATPAGTPAASPRTAVDGVAGAPGAASGGATAVDDAEDPTRMLRSRDAWQRQARQRRRMTAAELIMKRPRAPEARVPLERTETIVGRDPSCDIVLPEDSASRRHARIARNDGGYYEIEDLGSTNGILAHGEVVRRAVLLDGDSFTVGDTKFSIVIAPVVTPPPDAAG